MRRRLNLLSKHASLPILSVVYGIVAGLAAVAFMLAINHAFRFIWLRLTALGAWGFAGASLGVVILSSLGVGILLYRVYPHAAGSGIPELKSAYWTQLGEVPFRAVLVKWVGGVLSLVGGASLGREGPTVFVAGGLASCVAGWLGIDRRRRRHATVTGAAAGLAAAFNTPLAAVSFVVEEILGDLSSRFTGSVVLGAVAGAFVVYGLVGRQPAFSMPSVDAVSWDVYFVVPFVAVLAALAGVAFQRGSLRVRAFMKTQSRLPAWLRPAVGGGVVWVVGTGVYLVSHRLGVFGLGYDDLSEALGQGMGWRLAGLLALCKLVATVACYGTGGCGGIFSPTLFIGAMCGFFCAGIGKHWIPLTTADQLVLAATGMCACFGAVVRAPITSILMIFEMTHQFGMVPSLMIGSLISQAIARVAGKRNFYDAILFQDGREIHKITPSRNLAAWRAMPVGNLTTRPPVAVTRLDAATMRALLDRYSYRSFPVIEDGVLKGVTTRAELVRVLADGGIPHMETPVVCRADESLQAVESRLIQSTAGLFVVVDEAGGPVTGVFTLHDLLRAQAALAE